MDTDARRHLEPPPPLTQVLAAIAHGETAAARPRLSPPEPDPVPSAALVGRVVGPGPLDLPALEPSLARSLPSGTTLEQLSVTQIGSLVTEVVGAAQRAAEELLETAEAEAVRRSRLLVAQAELVAEMIRKHAEHDADAILADAQGRSRAQSAARHDEFHREVARRLHADTERLADPGISPARAREHLVDVVRSLNEVARTTTALQDRAAAMRHDGLTGGVRPLRPGRSG